MNKQYFSMSAKYEITIKRKDELDAYLEINCTNPDAEKYLISQLYHDFSFFVDGYKYDPDFKYGSWDGKKHLFNHKDNSFSLGLIPRVFFKIKEVANYFTVNLDQSVRRIFESPNGKLTPSDISNYASELNIVNDKGTPIVPFDHQIDILDKALNVRRASLVACTSAGKSLSIYLLMRYVIERENGNVLLIVPNKALVEQMYKDFRYGYGWGEDIDEHISKIHSDVKGKNALTAAKKKKMESMGIDPNTFYKDNIISTWQSLQSKDASFFKRFSSVIVDECHGTKADKLLEILAKCVNADIKIGVSGTIPLEGLAPHLIESGLGKRYDIIRAYELIDRGILTPVTIKSIRIPYDKASVSKIHREKYDGQVSLLTNNGSKSKVIEELIRNGKINTSQNTIVLFNKVDPLFYFKDKFEKMFPEFNCAVYEGSTKLEVREEVRETLEAGVGNLVFASFGTMKQGVNIKLLHNIVFAECSKSMITIVQSVGRLLRKHPDKDRATCYDIYDDASYWTKPRKVGKEPELQANYSMKHYIARKEFYDFEQFPIEEYDASFVATLDPVEEIPDSDRTKKRKARESKKKDGVKKKGWKDTQNTTFDGYQSKFF
jgi:superfamily II DNA or RNA helicase